MSGHWLPFGHLRTMRERRLKSSSAAPLAHAAQASGRQKSVASTLRLDRAGRNPCELNAALPVGTSAASSSPAVDAAAECADLPGQERRPQSSVSVAPTPRPGQPGPLAPQSPDEANARLAPRQECDVAAGDMLLGSRPS